MWITKDERRLLVAYSKVMANVAVGYLINPADYLSVFDKSCLRQEIVTKTPRLSQSEEIKRSNEDPTYDKRNRRYSRANSLLLSRKLIRKADDSQYETRELTLTIEGFDLAQRLSSWNGWIGLWFETHKEGVLGFIVSLVGGLFGGVISHLSITALSPEPPKADPPVIQMILPSNMPSTPNTSPTPTATSPPATSPTGSVTPPLVP